LAGHLQWNLSAPFSHSSNVVSAVRARSVCIRIFGHIRSTETVKACFEAVAQLMILPKPFQHQGSKRVLVSLSLPPE
jgi:hypothetical protein